MSLIKLILFSLIPLTGIWLSYWNDLKHPEDINERKKLKRKRVSSFISSVLVIIAFGVSYLAFNYELTTSKRKGKQELENYKNIQTVKRVSSKASESLESIISKSNASLKKSDSIIMISDSSIRRLESLNRFTLSLNYQLLTGIELQEQANKESQLLVNNMLSQQKRKEESYIVELKISLEQFDALSSFIMMSGIPSAKVISEVDSIRKIDQLISFANQSISVLISQLQNDLLIRDTTFHKIWILYLNSLRHIELHMYGYAPYPVYQDWDILQENSRTFVQKIEDFLIYKPFIADHTRDKQHQLKLVTDHEFRSE